jgi:hypothetical protein
MAHQWHDYSRGGPHIRPLVPSSRGYRHPWRCRICRLTVRLMARSLPHDLRLSADRCLGCRGTGRFKRVLSTPRSELLPHFGSSMDISKGLCQIDTSVVLRTHSYGCHADPHAAMCYLVSEGRGVMCRSSPERLIASVTVLSS